LDDLIANAECIIDSEEGPIPGTFSKGLSTIKIPQELLDKQN